MLAETSLAETFRGAQNRKAIKCQVPDKVQGNKICAPRRPASGWERQVLQICNMRCSMPSSLADHPHCQGHIGKGGF
jgi:hypothetical protein